MPTAQELAMKQQYGGTDFSGVDWKATLQSIDNVNPDQYDGGVRPDTSGGWARDNYQPGNGLTQLTRKATDQTGMTGNNFRMDTVDLDANGNPTAEWQQVNQSNDNWMSYLAPFAALTGAGMALGPWMAGADATGAGAATAGGAGWTSGYDLAGGSALPTGVDAATAATTGYSIPTGSELSAAGFGDGSGVAMTGPGGIGSASSVAGALGPGAYTNLGYTGLTSALTSGTSGVPGATTPTTPSATTPGLPKIPGVPSIPGVTSPSGNGGSGLGGVLSSIGNGLTSGAGIAGLTGLAGLLATRNRGSVQGIDDLQKSAKVASDFANPILANHGQLTPGQSAMTDDLRKNAAAVSAFALPMLQSGGQLTSQQKSSIDGIIDEQIRRNKESILQNAQNSGMGTDSLVTLQQSQQMERDMNNTRQAQYMQQQQTNVQQALQAAGLTGTEYGQAAQFTIQQQQQNMSNALTAMGISDSALSTVAQAQLEADKEAQQTAMQIAMVTAQLAAMSKGGTTQMPSGVPNTGTPTFPTTTMPVTPDNGSPPITSADDPALNGQDPFGSNDTGQPEFSDATIEEDWNHI